MNSHALADLLKSRRTNDIKFEVEVALEGYDGGDVHLVEMEDDRQRVVSGTVVAPEDVLVYNSEDDFLVLRLGCIFLGDPDAKAPPVLSRDEWKMVLQAIDRKIWAINHVGMDRVGRELFTQLRNKIQQAL